MTLRIVGVGEPTAGDDAVGVRVIERLRALGPPPGVELYALRDPSELATLLAGADRVVVIDAMLDPEHAGSVRLVEPHELGATAQPISSHGVDTLTAIAIARTLAGDGAFPEVRLLAIAITQPARFVMELSPAATAAVDTAAQRVLGWIRETAHA